MQNLPSGEPLFKPIVVAPFPHESDESIFLRGCSRSVLTDNIQRNICWFFWKSFSSKIPEEKFLLPPSPFLPACDIVIRDLTLCVLAVTLKIWRKGQDNLSNVNFKPRLHGPAVSTLDYQPWYLLACFTNIPGIFLWEQDTVAFPCPQLQGS